MIDLVDIEGSYKLYRQNGGIALDADRFVSRRMYNKIVNGLMLYIMKKVLDGYDVRLGAGLGIISIAGEKVKPLINNNGKIKGLAPDWGETKKLQARDEEAKKNKQIVYCFNEHSNGVKYKFVWSRRDVLIKNKQYYQFTFARANRRALAKLIKEGKQYYIKVEKEEYVRPSSYVKIENKD